MFLTIIYKKSESKSPNNYYNFIKTKNKKEKEKVVFFTIVSLFVLVFLVSGTS